MIYKTINTNGYYISEVTHENEKKKYIHIGIIMLQENAKIINSMMKKEGIEYTKYEEEIIETLKEEIDEVMTNMKDKQFTVNKSNIAGIKHMSWSTGNEKKIKEEIATWNTNEIQEYEITINNIIQTSTTEERKQSIYKAIIKLPLDVKFWVKEDKQETNTFVISTLRTNEQTLINALIKNNIPFMKGKTYIINEDNTDVIIWNILNNESIEQTYIPPKIAFEKKQLFIRVLDTIETDDIEENQQVSEYFYSSCRNIGIYIESRTFNAQNHTYDITLIGHMKQIEEYIDEFSTNERISIIQGTLMNKEEEIQYINDMKTNRKSIIDAYKKQEFDEIPIEEKKNQIQQIISNLSTSIKCNKNDDIRRYTEEIKKYNGLQLYSSNEDNTWLWEYIKTGDELLNNTENHTFISTNEEDITTRMYKCPHCDMYCNDIHNLQNHIVFNHKAKFRNDISFIMQYAMMMKEEKIASMEPHTSYKCAYCSYISTNAECTQKHCILTHKNRKAKLIEGTIGEEVKVRRYIQEKE